MITSRSLILRIGNVAEKFVEKFRTHILPSITAVSENGVDYKVLSQNMVEPDKPQTTI
jgi:hypothetical protein